MERFEIRVLGDPQFRLDGTPLNLKLLPRCLTIAGYLAVARDRPVSRASIATALWPDDDEVAARANLRRHIHTLVQALERVGAGNPIAAESSMLSWNREGGIWMDVIAFEEALKSGRSEDAIAVYGGDFLAGTYDDWVLDVREPLRSRYHDALFEAAERAYFRRDFSQATALASTLLRADEWREDALRLKMTSLYKSGERAGALAAYDALAKSLDQEMHVEPMPETRALRDAIVANVPLATIGERGEESTSGVPHRLLPFIGRQSETERLRGAWSRAARGAGSTVFVTGEAGIGKSRLLREFAAFVERQGGLVLAGSTSCPQAGPYESIARALRQALTLLQKAPLEHTWLAALAELVPELHALRTFDAPDRLREDAAQLRLTEAIVRAFIALTEGRPLMLVLEDIQWATSGTLDVVRQIARRAGSMSILIACTVRSGVANSHLVALRRSLQQEQRATTISLSPLTPTQFSEIAGGDSPFAGVSLETIGRIAELSGGNPLFAVTLLQQHLESGAEISEQQAVGTLSDAIAQRLGALDDDTRAIAQAAAVSSVSFSADFLSAIGGWSEAQVFHALDALLDGGIIRETAGEGFEYAFSHALLARSLYEAIPVSERRSRHRRVAVVLEARGDEKTTDVLARHWELAGQAVRAIREYERAALRAINVFAWDYARDCIEHALALTNDNAERFRLLSHVAGLQRRTGDVESWARDVENLRELASHLTSAEQIAALSHAERLARFRADRAEQARIADAMQAIANATADARFKGEAALVRSHYEGDSANLADAVTCADRALEHFAATEMALSVEREIAICVDLGSWLGWLTRFDEAARWIERAEQLSRQGSTADRCSVLLLKALNAFCRDDLAANERWCQELLSIAEETGDLVSQLNAHLQMAESLARWPSRLRRHHDEAARLIEQTNKTIAHVSLLVNRGYYEIAFGRLDLAWSYNLEAERLARASNRRGSILHAVVNLSQIAHLKGDTTIALGYAEQAWEIVSTEETQPRVAAAALRARGLARIGLGDHERGLTDLREALRTRRDAGAYLASLDDAAVLADALLQTGSQAESATLGSAIEGALDDARFDRYRRPTHLCAVLGKIALAAGNETKAEEWMRRGRRFVEEFLSRVDEQETKDAFLALPYNRALSARQSSDT